MLLSTDVCLLFGLHPVGVGVGFGHFLFFTILPLAYQETALQSQENVTLTDRKVVILCCGSVYFAWSQVITSKRAKG